MQANLGKLRSSFQLLRVTIHPGANDDGYWTSANVAEQLRNTIIPIFNILHPNDEFQGLFCFDNSSNHQCFAPDALVTMNLNVSDGGTKTVGKLLRNTTFNDKPQKMQNDNGIQKGL